MKKSGSTPPNDELGIDGNVSESVVVKGSGNVIHINNKDQPSSADKKGKAGSKSAMIWMIPVAFLMVICFGATVVLAIGMGSFINIGGDVTNSPFIINPSGDVTINQNSPVPSPIASASLEINANEITAYCVDKGNIISVNASGGIVVGPSVGSVGPEGTNSGVLGLSLDAYDIIPEFAHGALLCKVDTESEWRECGAELIFQTQSSGCLQFNINDNDQSNNNGAFDVEMLIYKEE